MKKTLVRLAKPRVQLWIWGIATIVWLVLLIPSVLWWKESILWIIIMSWWANVAGSASAYLATHSEKAQDSEEDS